jgi:hypothetical protein
MDRLYEAFRPLYDPFYTGLRMLTKLAQPLMWAGFLGWVLSLVIILIAYTLSYVDLLLLLGLPPMLFFTGLRIYTKN